jgi:DNA polymerase-3 subunit delta'
MNAPWITAQARQLLAQRGHAWILAGPSGLGQYDLGLALVSAWLCEKPGEDGACGQCGSCHALSVHTHADLCVLMPETIMLELGWPLSEKAQDDIDKKTRKPSKEIRIDAMRDAVEFAQRTNARGRGKAVLVFPAERMNHITANALLKTLEEPPGDVKFVLATEAAHQLLPTIRSRCLGHTMVWPQTEEALSWLASQGVNQGEILLHAAGGRPADVAKQMAAGQTPVWWSGFPKAMAQGDASALTALSPAQAIEALQKLCHDLVLLRSGAVPRFFKTETLPPCKASIDTLTAWFKRLSQASRTSEHPFNPGLMLEALASDARLAIQTAH